MTLFFSNRSFSRGCEVVHKKQSPCQTTLLHSRRQIVSFVQ